LASRMPRRKVDYLRPGHSTASLARHASPISGFGVLLQLCLPINAFQDPNECPKDRQRDETGGWIGVVESGKF